MDSFFCYESKTIEIKNSDVILTEKQRKYQHYHPKKLIIINILQVKKYCLLIKDKQQNKSSVHIFHLDKLFGTDINLSAHINIKNNKDILIIGNGPTQVLDNTTLTTEAKYPNYFI